MFMLGAGAAAAAGAAAGGAVAAHRARKEMDNLFGGEDDERAERRAQRVTDRMREDDLSVGAHNTKRAETRQNARDDIRHKYGLGGGPAMAHAEHHHCPASPIDMQVAGWLSTGFVPHFAAMVNHRLFLYKKAEDKEPVLRIELKNGRCSLDRHDEERRTLKVTDAAGKEHIFRLATTRDAQRWRDQISDTISSSLAH